MVVGLCIALLALRLLPAVALLIQLLHMRIGPMQVIPGMHTCTRQPGEVAALHELLALGFEHAGTARRVG